MHPIHCRNARKNRPEILQQIEKNKLLQISAKDTLFSLRKQFPDALLTLRNVENIYADVKKTINCGLPAVQAMISKLGDEFQYYYALGDHDCLERVLFFHNVSLQLFRRFPKNYILDATYKTNRFNLPLLILLALQQPTNYSLLARHS